MLLVGGCLAEEHAAGVLDVLLDLDEEGDCFPAVEQSVVIGEGEIHHLWMLVR